MKIQTIEQYNTAIKRLSDLMDQDFPDDSIVYNEFDCLVKTIEDYETAVLKST